MGERSDGDQNGQKKLAGGLFAGGKVQNRDGKEFKRVSLMCVLFADDTTIVGMSWEIDEADEHDEKMGKT